MINIKNVFMTTSTLLIKTKRLEIYALTLEALLLFITKPQVFAVMYGYKGDFRFDNNEVEVIKKDLLPSLKLAQGYWYYYTMWLMVDRQNQTIVGSFCFYGKPDIHKAIEIGYGVSSNQQNKGYMNEALMGVIDWCTKNILINMLKARCDISNEASNRLLKKSGFLTSKINQKENLIDWYINVNHQL